MHDPREAGHAARGLPRQRSRTKAGATRRRDRRRRLLRGGSARAHLRAVPVRRRRLRTGLDPTPRRLGRRRRLWRRRAVASGRTSTSRPISRSVASVVPGLGAGLDGLQLHVRVLHRPGCPRPRAEPSPWRDRRRSDRSRRAACARSRCSARTSTRGAATSLPDLRTEFGELLRACDAVEGIERIRFTSPHPKDFREPVIAAIAECASVCEHVHLPLQSGSSRILKRMRRTYDRDRYLRLVESLRAAIPDLALGTDVIVGFPGETDDDFAETLAVVETVRFDSAFTFIFSPRAGTEAADMPDQVPDEVKHERLERLVEVTQRIAAERNAERIGGVEEVLVEGSSRTDPAMLRGRTRRNTMVNFAGSAPAGSLSGSQSMTSTSTTLRGHEVSLVARSGRLAVTCTLSAHLSHTCNDSGDTLKAGGGLGRPVGHDLMRARGGRGLRPDGVRQVSRRGDRRRRAWHGGRVGRRDAGVPRVADSHEPACVADAPRRDPDLSHEFSVGEYAAARSRGDRRARSSEGSRRRLGWNGPVPARRARRSGAPARSRDRRRARAGSARTTRDPDAAHMRLRELDPAAAAVVHRNDRRRVVRALELARAASSLVPHHDRLWSTETRRPTLVVGLDVPPDVLELRIRARTEAMFARGVIDEVRRAVAGEILEDRREGARSARARELPPDCAGAAHRSHTALRRLPAEVDAKDRRRRHDRRRPSSGGGGG